MDPVKLPAVKHSRMRRVLAGVFRIGGVVGLALALSACLVMQPTCSNKPATLQANPELLKQHLRTLTESFGPRYHDRPENLAKCRGFLIGKFQECGATTEEQGYQAMGRRFYNVRAFFGSKDAPRIVIGAHYDAVGAGAKLDRDGSKLDSRDGAKLDY